MLGLDFASTIMPDFDKYIFIISISLCVLLGAFTYLKGVLDWKGSILAVILGMLLIGYSDFFWFLLMLFFLLVSYGVTIFKYKKKKEMGISQGKVGERGVRNVVANGIIPLIIALFSSPLDEVSEGLSGILFLVAISIAASDSFGSEIGVLSSRPRLITNPMRIVEPGVDGGVSLLGNIAALLGGVLVAGAGYLLITDRLITTGPHLLEASALVVIITIVMGWIGCQIDSLLGATLQTRGLITNNMVNFITILLGVIIVAPLYILLF